MNNKDLELGLNKKTEIYPYTIYTVQKCRKDETFYGPTHGSDDGEKSLCGIEFNHNWYIINNTFDGKITCKKCLDILNKTSLVERRIANFEAKRIKNKL